MLIESLEFLKEKVLNCVGLIIIIIVIIIIIAEGTLLLLYRVYFTTVRQDTEGHTQHSSVIRQIHAYTYEYTDTLHSYNYQHTG